MLDRQCLAAGVAMAALVIGFQYRTANVLSVEIANDYLQSQSKSKKLLNLHIYLCY